jgi:hypothetical protein
MWYSTNSISKRLQDLEHHLGNENPLLVTVVKSFHKLDKIGYATGMLEHEQSFASQISWWPLISILGTFSAGKSTFLNHYLGQPIQQTGNQAVDDKFTVICYSEDATSRVLPGIALDADPRFPFYQISKSLDEVAPGEGQRIDSYLQLKTCSSDVVRGRILIDSPGFDADAQRQAILRSTEHIINLSDLVLVFFDARHPEPGAMRETLSHLVARTIERQDAVKFLFILNQIDTAAGEDNPEDVIASWQRALASEGLTAGRFFTIYNPDVAVPIENAELRKRYEDKRDRDLALIHERMANVSVERSYRIISLLDQTAKDIERKWIPELGECIRRWRVRTLWFDAGFYSLLLLLFVAITVGLDYWEGLRFSPPWLESAGSIGWLTVIIVIIGVFLAYLHFLARKIAGRGVIRWIQKKFLNEEDAARLTHAFRKNSRPWRSIFARQPAGWNKRAVKKLKDIVQEADSYVQMLNDRFTNPSGEKRDKHVADDS